MFRKNIFKFLLFYFCFLMTLFIWACPSDPKVEIYPRQNPSNGNPGPSDDEDDKKGEDEYKKKQDDLGEEKKCEDKKPSPLDYPSVQKALDKLYTEGVSLEIYVTDKESDSSQMGESPDSKKSFDQCKIDGDKMTDSTDSVIILDCKDWKVGGD